MIQQNSLASVGRAQAHRNHYELLIQISKWDNVLLTNTVLLI